MNLIRLQTARLAALAVSASFFAVPMHAAPISGLVAYYPLLRNTQDASGKTNDGAVIGYDVKYSQGLFLNRMSPPTNIVDDLGGTYVIARRSALLDFNQDFTLSVWVNITNGLPAYYPHNLIGNGPDDTSANFRVISDDDNGQDYLQFVCNHATGDIHAFVEPVRGVWWQAVVVRSGTNVSLFRNGVLETNGAMTATITNYPTIWLGRYSCDCPASDCPSSYSLSGGINDVRMYNRALTAEEVLQIYRNHKLNWP